LISHRQRFLNSETYRSLMHRTDEIGRMLFGLTVKVEANVASQAPVSSDL